MLALKCTFDLHADVIPHLLELRENTNQGTVETATFPHERKAQIVNVEGNGCILYTWKGAYGSTYVGIYDPSSRQNKILYSFEKEVSIISCSVNRANTLLAVSILQKTDHLKDHFRPVSKCLTLLIEIHPVNNTKVLKAVDKHVRVQFLYPEYENKCILESHLLLISEDRYIEQLHISLTIEEGYRVVLQNLDCIPKDKVAEDFSWVQWDAQTQMLHLLFLKDNWILKCYQFYPDRNFDVMFQVPLDLPVKPISKGRLVNFGHGYCEENETAATLNLRVFTSGTGSMCVCYSHPTVPNKEEAYTVAFIHRGCSKTFTVSSEIMNSPRPSQVFFVNLDYYIAVCSPGHFIHFINTKQTDYPCHNLYFSGQDSEICSLSSKSIIVSTPDATLIDVQMGKIWKASLSHSALLEFLHRSKFDSHKLGALHCAVVYLAREENLDVEIINWLTEKWTSNTNFNLYQEFILASLYRKIRSDSFSLDKILPYTSVSVWEEEIPGVKCSSDLLPQPTFLDRTRNLKGFWEEFRYNVEVLNYFDAAPNLRYNNSLIREEWNNLLAEMSSEESKSSSHLRHFLENTKKVLSILDTWRLDTRVVPLFQEEDNQQRVLIGLIVDKLRDHLNRHFSRLGKKKIDMLALNYVAELLALIKQILETVWVKYELDSQALCLKHQGNSAEWAVFHIMCQILEAGKDLCLPFPPGFHSLHAVLGVRCLPIHTFLLYIDHGVLQLTETFVTLLMKDLDNTQKNEQLKFSVMSRLSETMSQKLYHLWDHPITSAFIAQNYVKTLFANHGSKECSFINEDYSNFHLGFLPLAYLAQKLSAMENMAVNPFEEQENVDAKFVEEFALKNTSIELGFEKK
ncbi:gamma-secretase-activating protein isoform X2 [Polypterus senegalus]|uniref:gamma-secretase-activating protein isoform X2 n=1 Tax=Polypterus senegalus TaxID=55291 RepID=UPI001964B9DA|nr:gamma-secretase-activating protein isoform X2 [Polypterus senegalus]